MTKNIHFSRVLLGLSILLVVFGWYHPLSLIFRTTLPPQYVIYNHLFSDDTFYYMEIGKNIIEKSTSTFDGITKTNGYQPFWMILIVLLGYLSPIDSLTYAISLLCAIVIFVTIGTYSFYCLQKQFFPSKTNYFTTVSYMFSALFISRLGMETCLIFLFFPIFIQACIRCIMRQEIRDSFLAGILGSLLILSRLDSFLLVGLIYGAMIIYLMVIKKSFFSIHLVLAFLGGLLPIVIYLVINRIAFGHFFPFSGIAKSLHLKGFIFSQRSWGSVINTIRHEKYLLIFFLVSLVSLPYNFFRFVNEKRIIDFLMIVILLFPYFFYWFYFLMSDWPLWLWYFYPLSLSFSFSVLFMEDYFVNHKIPARITQYLLIISTLGLFAYTLQNYVSHLNEKFTPGATLSVALKIKDFAAAHPGTYAMGDRAGIVGFLLPDPLIQLEGLVSDETMIENISTQRNLHEVLLSYGVDYYVTSTPANADGCVELSEPSQPGPNAPRMRMHLCEAPMLLYDETGYAAVYKITPDSQ